MDRVTAEVRSAVMASVRSRGNKSTELALRMLLVRNGMRGWRLCAAELDGKPDFAFDEARVAVFVDGCQWHGCPRCYRPPKSNSEYWQAKVTRNRQRDRMVNQALSQAGWAVVRVWEHELKESPEVVLQRLNQNRRPQC